MLVAPGRPMPGGLASAHGVQDAPPMRGHPVAVQAAHVAHEATVVRPPAHQRAACAASGHVLTGSRGR